MQWIQIYGELLAMRKLLLLLCLSILQCQIAFSGQAYSAGTVFTENFGNTVDGAEPCWSGATGDAAKCKQPWVILEGAGAAIADAPGDASKALYLPGDTTVLKLTTYGSFPLIPPDTPFSFSMDVAVSSFPASDTVLMKLHSYGGVGEDTYVTVSSTGFSGEYHNCAVSAGALHTIRLDIDGAARAFYVDGVQCGSSWTYNNFAVGAITIFGGTTYNTYVKEITISGSTITGGWPPSVIFDWAGQTGTPDAGKLQAGTHCGNGVTGTDTPGRWAMQPLVNVSYSFEDNGTLFASSANVCGTTYPGTTKTLKMTVTAGPSTGNWGASFNSVFPAMAVGCQVQFNSTGPISAMDILGISTADGLTYGFWVKTDPADNTKWYVCLENSGDIPSVSSCLDTIFSPNTIYWLTSSRGTGQDYYGAYTTDGRLIEQKTIPGTQYSYEPGAVTIGWGTGAKNEPYDFSVQYSNCLFSYADAAFPLLPPLAGSRYRTLLGVGK